MRILFTDATLMHGGAERVLSILCNRLVELGHEVEVLLYYDRPIWYEIDRRVHIANDEENIGKKNVLKHIRFRHRYFRNSDADVIVSFLAPFNMINIIASMHSGKKLIVADRNDPRCVPSKRMVRVLRDILYRFADGIVLQSIKNQAYFSKCVQRKSTVIFNPVDLGESKGAALSSEKSHEIVAVGRLIEQKNPMMLLHAFAAFEKTNPDYKLIYYGEGNLREAIAEEASRLGIRDKVLLPGAVHNIFEAISHAEIFAMTSFYEGMPNALIEAMCLGMPVVSTKVSGAVDLIEDDVNGRLIEVDDTAALTEALKELAAQPELRERYARNACQLSERLKADQIVAEWTRFIEEVKQP